MTATQRTVQVPPAGPPGRPRRRRPMVVVGAGLLVLTAGTVGAVAFGVSTASSLRQDVVSESVPGVRELVVEIDQGSLVLRAGTDTVVDVRTTRVWAGDDGPVVGHDLDGDVLTVTSDCPSFESACEVEQEVVVPAGTVVRVRTVDGPIDAVGLDVPRFSADSVAGAVSVDFTTRPEAVGVRTVGGDVRVAVPAGGYRIDTGTVVGSVVVDIADDPAAAARIDARTISGDIVIEQG